MQMMPKMRILAGNKPVIVKFGEATPIIRRFRFLHDIVPECGRCIMQIVK